ncbi:MAG: ATP-binding protein [Burkholderiaceae bacterium]|jgi:signal transduction histidine kinase|nr:ATP-binding protein [Burkholderiaceae bacterium]MCZ8175602.1 ATP-binding protein [Burkholderiaceae bacterium]
MKPARRAEPPRSGSAAHIAEQLPRRRRRLGLALVALGVLGLAVQSSTEWLLPYNLAPLDTVRRLAGSPLLTAQQLAWGWALLSLMLLAALAHPRRPPLLLPALAGLVLGSVHAAAGGGAASLALLLLVGVASLGWHAGREGGLSMLLATALSSAAWEWLVSDFPSLWAVAPILVTVFVWIDLMHMRVNDRRLFGALAERDTLIDSLDQRTAELTALQGARTQLLASISHDLRQPLQAVRLYAEALQAADAPAGGTTTTLRAGPESPDPETTMARARRSELLRQQMRAADDATAMLDQFSEFSALEQGMLLSHPEPVEVRDILDAVAASLQATHAPAQLRLSVHGRRQWVFADRTQLARLVQNLAGNAVRYSVGVRPGRTARVVLAVRPHTRGGEQGLVIDVVDNGRGIPADKLEAVFEPYVQLGGGAAGASRGGRGLGLTIVRGLAAQLKLQIEPIRSRVGRGTRFRVWVPGSLRRELPAPPGPAAAAPADASRLDGWLLALLDDEAAPRTALRAALEGAGATIVDAGALDQLKLQLDEEPRFPDALVIDHDLGAGKPDGVASLLELRAEWELMVPAVVVTGRVAALGSIALPRRCVLLAKPVALATLVATLQRLRPAAAGATTGSVDIPVDIGGR